MEIKTKDVIDLLAEFFRRNPRKTFVELDWLLFNVVHKSRGADASFYAVAEYITAEINRLRPVPVVLDFRLVSAPFRVFFGVPATLGRFVVRQGAAFTVDEEQLSALKALQK